MDKIYSCHEEFNNFNGRANEEIYTDAVWTSLCREHEDTTRRRFQDIIGQRSGLVLLVDAVPEDYAKYQCVITDNFLRDCTTDHVSLYPEYWGTFAYQPRYLNRSPRWLFNCFVHRNDAWRQTFVYQLLRHQMLRKGAVSFHCHAPSGHSAHRAYQGVFDRDNLKEFAVEHELLRTEIPYKNFTGEIDQTMVDSKISVILESYTDMSYVVALSEKIFRALQIPRPFVLGGCWGSVALLRDHGFDVYDDLVDHAYDLVPNSLVDRDQLMHKQHLMLHQIKRVGQINFDHGLLQHLEIRASKNRARLQELRQQWPKKLERSLQAAVIVLERNSHKYSI